MRRAFSLAAALGYILAGFVGIAASADAQTAIPGGLILRGVPAEDAVLQLAERSGLSIVFNPTLPGLDRPVWCGRAGDSAEAILACITRETGLDYVRRSTGTYVITEPPLVTLDRGGLIGGVVDSETLVPLASAHVRVVGANLIATTNDVGAFAIRGLLPGHYELAISYIGYESAQVTIEVPSGETAQVHASLAPVALLGETVVVDGVQAPLPSIQLGADALYDSLGGIGSRRTSRLDAPVRTPPSLTVQGPRTTADATAPSAGILGVTSRTLLDGLSVQGGDDGESPVRLDGATVYEPVALGSLVGALSPLAIGRVTVHKAGFGVEHGSTLAGVIDAEHTTAGPDSASALDVTLEADALATGARLRHRLDFSRPGQAALEATTVLSVRSSTWPYWRPSALASALRNWNRVDPILSSQLLNTGTLRFDPEQQSTEVAFRDLHAASRVAFGDLRTLRASIYHGRSRVRTNLFAVEDTLQTEAESVLSRDRYTWTNSTLSLRYDAVLSASWSVHAALTASRHTLDQRYDIVAGLVLPEGSDREKAIEDALTVQPDIGVSNQITSATLLAQAELRHGPRHRSHVGMEVGGLTHHLDLSSSETASLRQVRADEPQSRLTVFASNRRMLGTRWTVEPGLRWTVLPRSARVTTEPRVALRYDALPDDQLGPVSLRGVAARAALGAYRQFVSRYELATFGPSALAPSVALWLPTPSAPNASSTPPLSLHLAGELLWQRPGWTVRTEGYVKSTPRLYALDYAVLLAGSAVVESSGSILRAGEGRAAGIGLHVERHHPRWAASGEIAVAQSSQRFENRFAGAWTPTPWEEPLRVRLALDVALVGSRATEGLVARSRAMMVAGKSWAYRRAYYDVLPVLGQARVGDFDTATPGDDMLPTFLQLDVGLAWRTTIRGTRLEAAFEVTNATARANVLDLQLERAPDAPLETVTRTLPGAQPSLRIRILR